MCCVDGVHSVPNDVAAIAGINTVAVADSVEKPKSASSPRASKPRPDQFLFNDYELFQAYLTDEISKSKGCKFYDAACTQ